MDIDVNPPDTEPWILYRCVEGIRANVHRVVDGITAVAEGGGEP